MGFVVFLCLFSTNLFSQPPVNLDSISQRLSTGTSEEKRDALFQIKNLQTEPASRLAIPALTDTDEMVRATAVSAVIFLPKEEAGNLLLPLLKDKAEFVRRETAYALGRTGYAPAAASLIAVGQKDKILEVRSAAVIALGEIGDASAIPFLTSTLQKKIKEDDEFIRRSAARSIGQIAQIMRAGKVKVLTPQNFLPEKYKEIEYQNTDFSVQNQAFTAAEKILLKTLQNKKEAADTRREAAFALGAIGSVSALNILRTALNDKDPYIAEISKEALLKIPKPE